MALTREALLLFQNSLIALIAALALIVLPTAPCDAATVAKELLADPDFSSDASSWFLQDATFEPLDPSTGAQQVHLQGMKPGPHSESHVGTEVKPLPIDHDLTFSCQLRGTHGEQQITINAYAYDASHRQLKSWYRIMTVKPGTWIPFSARYIPPANADCIVLWIINKSGQDAYASHPSMLQGDAQTSVHAPPTASDTPSTASDAAGSGNKASSDFDSIINNVATRYGTCKTYRDCGTARDPGQAYDRETFNTWFVRPSSFHFEWSDFRGPHRDGTIDKSAVWSNADGAFASYSFSKDKTEKEKNLEMAVAGATGVSRGVIYTIYNFLLKDPRQRSLFDTNNWTITDDEVAGRPAYLLVSKPDAKGEFNEVWFTKDD